MTKEELIEILNQLPGGLTVKLRNSNDELVDINNVDTDIERDQFDGDWNQSVIVLY